MRSAICFLINLAVLVPVLVQPARAAGAETAYVVAYFETRPAAAAQAQVLLRQFGEASRRDAGNLRFEVLRRIGLPDQFLILEAWKNQDALAAHAAADHARQFREKLRPLLRGPYDERPQVALATGAVDALPASDSAKAAVYAVTHVDVVPTQREPGAALVRQLSEAGRQDPGNARFESLTQSSRPNHMTVVEIWVDDKARAVHGMTAHKRQFREQLLPLSGGLYDERLYQALD